MATLTYSSSQFTALFSDFTKIGDNVLKETNLEDFLKLELIGIKESPTISDGVKAISEFKKSIKMVNERYQVRWPWSQEIPDLPDNYNLAYGSLNSMIQRLRENLEMLKMYDDVIKD